MKDGFFEAHERNKIMEYFGKSPENLTPEEFELAHRVLRSKYHPDKFEKYNNELVKELSLAKFKEIEVLADKLKQFFALDAKEDIVREDHIGTYPKYAGNNLYIEIITKDKELKYHLFGTKYTFLLAGDKYTIKGTNASIIIDEKHNGRTIGYNESIKMYLTFSEDDSLDDIMMWLYEKIKERATSINIDGNIVHVNFNEMMAVVRQKTILRLGSGSK